MLQKPLKPGRRFSRLKPTQAKVATKSGSGPITEVTDELSARSCDPPHAYTKNAPTAQKFSDQRCKWTFATVSAPRVTWCDAAICPHLGDKRKSLALARNDVNDPMYGPAVRCKRTSSSWR